jgi:hypothetical protein
MPVGTFVTSYIADLFPNDPLAPQVVGDFAEALPPNPVKGNLVSVFADNSQPGSPPIHSSDVGALVSDMVVLLVQPDTGLGDYLI